MTTAIFSMACSFISVVMETEILKGVTQVALYTKGTKYALDDERIQLLGHFMRGTYYQVIRGQYMLFDVLGRGVSRNMLPKRVMPPCLPNECWSSTRCILMNTMRL